MLDFLGMFSDIVLYPLSIELVNFDDNPLLVISIATLFGLGCVSFLRRFLSCRI